MKMKKGLTVLLSSALILSVPLTSASAVGQQPIQQDFISSYLQTTEVFEEETIYTYLHNGIEISSNVQLTDSQVTQKLDQVKELSSKKSKNLSKSNDLTEITPYVQLPVDMYPGTITAGPYYDSYDNAIYREAADLLVAWVTTKVPAFLSKSTFTNYVTSKFLGWSSAIKDTYVGSWQSKSWNPSLGLYEYHNTIVHYEDSQFRTPRTVTYYVVYRANS
ncbi:hypothetical protein [Bacillus sp. Cr_A10]|uniref:hypothetical protein n=1 Tax=Bacillus sp. Cr_A10 TaxID=3033993 RepID=UPI0023DB3304|nr:hypothetical protein [Bacillus sp. Cr_A10]MDF2067466.1 hypothetical protein [Bacillus sp. Cr_A10]